MSTASTRAFHLVSVACAALSVFAFLPLFVAAQENEGIQIQPAIIEEKVVPGQTYQFSVKVTNVSDVEKTLYLDVADIEGVDVGGTPRFAAPGTIPVYAVSEWVTLPQGGVTLGAGASANVSFTVRVPAEPSPGTHFGSVFFDVRAPEQRTTGAGVGFKVGTILTLQVPGETIEQVRVREFSTDATVYGAPSINFLSKVENLGNVLARPHGLIEITDMLGRKVATVPVNDVGASVFPGADRAFSSLWEGQGFYFGRYEAALALVYGDEQRQTITAATSFWVLPLKPIALTLGIIIALVVGLWLWVRTYIRRQLHGMGIPRKGGDLDYYARRHGSGGNLLVVALSLVVLCIVLLTALFFLFA